MQVKTPVKKTAENKQQYRSPEKTYNKGTINEKKALQGLELTLQSEDFVTFIGGNGA